MKNHRTLFPLSFYESDKLQNELTREAKILGFKKTSQREDFLKEIKRARFYQFQNLLIPLNSSPRKEKLELLRELSLEFKLHFLIVDSAEITIDLPDYREVRVISSYESLAACSSLYRERDKKSGDDFTKRDFLFLVHNKFRPHPEDISDREIEESFLSHASYYFFTPIKEDLRDPYLSTREVKNLSLKWLSQNLKFNPLPGLLQRDPRTPEDLDFFPVLKPLYERSRSLAPIRDTFIIPCFNQKKELRLTLLAMAQMNTDFGVQIIIVDDGSTDGLLSDIREILATLPDRFDYFYIRNPRVYPRSMGDGRFRAGISRNLGLRFAQGKFIHFIDSDILLPPDFLSKTHQQWQENEIIQLKRYDLAESLDENLFGNVTPSESLWTKLHSSRPKVLDNSYWYDFYDMAEKEDWNKFNCPWKYICTYGLSIKRQDLEEMGSVAPHYIFYGFEDTDLGFRLFKRGKRFRLSSVVGYHQVHPKERSEFGNLRYKRSQVLSKTAPVFYFTFLDLSIYYELGDFIFPFYSLKQWLIYLFCFFKKKEIGESK